MIKNAVFIPAPRATVFAALTGYAHYTEWLPGCERCSVAGVQGRSTQIEIDMNISRKFTMGLRFDAEPDHLLNFDMTSGKELKTYRGAYRLMDAEDGKGTVLFTELDMEVRSLPRFLTDGMAKKSLEQAGLALKKHVEKMPRPKETAAAPVAETARPAVRHKARRILQIVKLPSGYRIWFSGRTLMVKNIGGGFFER